ncbi:MAG: CHASE domain-containing protein, partial [Deltaproteobacteria bacterium]
MKYFTYLVKVPKRLGMYNNSHPYVPILLFSKMRKLILLIGVSLSMVAGWSVRAMLKSNHEANELVRLEKVAENISNGLDRFQDGLQSTAGINFTHRYDLNPKTFRSYSQKINFFDNLKGARGFGFIRRVRNIEKQAYLKKQRLRNPLFKEHFLYDPSASKLDDNLFIEMIEPYETNKQALGLDIGSERFRQEAAL